MTFLFLLFSWAPYAGIVNSNVPSGVSTTQMTDINNYRRFGGGFVSCLLAWLLSPAAAVLSFLHLRTSEEEQNGSKSGASSWADMALCSGKKSVSSASAPNLPPAPADAEPTYPSAGGAGNGYSTGTGPGAMPTGPSRERRASATAPPPLAPASHLHVAVTSSASAPPAPHNASTEQQLAPPASDPSPIAPEASEAVPEKMVSPADVTVATTATTTEPETV